MALFWAAIRRNSVFLFYSHVQVFPCEISLVCPLKCPSNCFYSHSCLLIIVVPLIFVLLVLFLVAVISLSLLFLYSLRVVLSMYQRYLQCWEVLFLLLFLIHIVCPYHLLDVRPDTSSLVFSFSCPFVEVLPSFTLRMVPSILRQGQLSCLSLWWNFCNVVWFQVVSSFSCNLFISSPFVWWCPLQIFQYL